MPLLPETNNLGFDRENMVKMRNVCKTYAGGVVALDHFSLDVRRGEVLVIIGPSGAGKSTLLRCLNGLELIDSGSIVIDGIPLDKNEANQLAIRRKIGMVFQSFNLFPHLSVQENINLAQRLVQKKSPAQANTITRDLLHRSGGTGQGDALSRRTFRRTTTTGGHCPCLGPVSKNHAL